MLHGSKRLDVPDTVSQLLLLLLLKQSFVLAAHMGICFTQLKDELRLPFTTDAWDRGTHI